VTLVTAFSSMFISMIRHHIPNSVRIIVQMAIIASLVIVVDQLLRALPMKPQTALGVCRADHHQLYRDGARGSLRHENAAAGELYGRYRQRSGLRRDPADVGFLRELIGSGKLFGITVLDTVQNGGWYLPNGLFLLAPSAFFIIGLLIWLIRTLKPEQQEKE
jgi:Na+-transporting NADH:ubiquinone oxidoreductase subunit D